jgi:hypothetical protein
MFDAQNEIEHRKKRWLDIFDRTKPDIHLFFIRYYPGLPARPWPVPENYEARISWAIEKYRIQMNNLEWLKDDTIPYLDVFTGTEIFPEAFGCSIVYPENDMPFALPMIHSVKDIKKVKIPPLDVPPLKRLFSIAKELRKETDPGALVRLIDVQTPMDIVALIMEKSCFYSALIEAPDAVMELESIVKQLMTRFLDEWFSQFGEEFIAHCPDFYMPQGITVSEDEVGSVSPRMFNELFLPELIEWSDRYGGIGMHCCANAHHQWDNFNKIPNLKLLNLVQPKEVTLDALKYFSHRVVQMHTLQLDGAIWTWPDFFPTGVRYVFEAGAANQDEALILSEKLDPIHQPRQIVG